MEVGHSPLNINEKRGKKGFYKHRWVIILKRRD